MNACRRMATALMEQKSQARIERIAEGNKRKWESSQGGNNRNNNRDNTRHNQLNNQRQGNARAMTTAPAEQECIQLFEGTITEKEPKEKRLEDVPVIRDFPEVFPDDLPGLPPPRQVEFEIELVPSAAPVARAPPKFSIVRFLALSRAITSRHVIDNKGVHMDPAKVEAIRNWSAPTTPKEVRQFLGTKCTVVQQNNEESTVHSGIKKNSHEQRRWIELFEVTTSEILYHSCRRCQHPPPPPPRTPTTTKDLLDIMAVPSYPSHSKAQSNPSRKALPARSAGTPNWKRALLLTPRLQSQALEIYRRKRHVAPTDIDYGVVWDRHLPLVEFSYNNSYHASIKAAPIRRFYLGDSFICLFAGTERRGSQSETLMLMLDANRWNVHGRTKVAKGNRLGRAMIRFGKTGKLSPTVHWAICNKS
ncbi:hypothetical protein Tco_0700599 [Tanacetum coccineum]